MVLGVIGVLGSAQRDDEGDITDPGTLEWYELQEGDCFDFISDELEVFSVTGIPCAEPHVNEVFWTGDAPGTEYPTDDAFIAFTEETCIPAFETYVDHEYDTSVWWLDTIWPTSDAWDQGERTMICYLFNDDESPTAVSGSAEGSGQ